VHVNSGFDVVVYADVTVRRIITPCQFLAGDIIPSKSDNGAVWRFGHLVCRNECRADAINCRDRDADWRFPDDVSRHGHIAEIRDPNQETFPILGHFQ